MSAQSLNTPSTISTAASRIARHSRLVTLCVLVAVACFMAYRLGQVWANWRHLAEQRPTRQSMSVKESAMAAAMLPLAGQWAFDDLDWSIQSKVLNRDEVASRLDAFAKSNGGATAEQLPDVSPEFLKLAQDLHIEPVSRAGNLVYALDRPEMMGQMVTREVAGHAKVISLAAAMPQNNDHWQLFEFSPKQTTGDATKRADHLLPLPSTAHRAGGRFGDRGELLLEIVELDSNADHLLGAWRDAGWDVHPTGLGDDDSFSYLCTHGNDTIYVWSADAKDALHSLMLSRNPDNAELAAKQ